MRRSQVTTLGEALIVFDPASRGPLRRVRSFEKRIGGAELNVAVALARMGHRSSWAGKLGEDEFGAEISAFLRGEGVDVSEIIFDPSSPTGIYFKERRALDRLQVYYYRAGSAASKARFEDFDLERLLNTDILHLTGITLALSEECRDLVHRLMDTATDRDVTVSFDANVRFNLFRDESPSEVILPFAERADLLFLSDEEAELLFGGDDPETVLNSARDLRVETVVVHGAERSFAVEGSEITEHPTYPVEVVDTVGAGDAFVAGFLSGRLRGWKTGESLELANACGACAVTVPGDAESMPFEAEAMALVQGTRRTER